MRSLAGDRIDCPGLWLEEVALLSLCNAACICTAQHELGAQHSVSSVLSKSWAQGSA